MKLNAKKIGYILRELEKGRSPKDVGPEVGVTERRVKQIWKKYRDTQQVPIIGMNVGRPKKARSEEEKHIVKEAWDRDKLGARMLETIIWKRKKVLIPHNRIHEYLLELGYAQEMKRKKASRKIRRYERKHTLSAVHMDWCEDGPKDTEVGAIIDDSCRKISAGGEYDSANTVNSNIIFNDLVENYYWIRPARELIIDRGSEFGAHRARDNPDWESEFKSHVLAYGTKVILIRRAHPQSNGKIERWFETYQKFRADFTSFNGFMNWYKDRPHGSLDFKNIETPNQAFWRKLPSECLLGVASRLFGWEINETSGL
jgi:putative transposase